MIPQIIGHKKSQDTRKVQRFCKERGIAFQFVNIQDGPLSPGELQKIAEAAGGYGNLIDENSKTYKQRNMAYLEFDPEEELLEHPQLLRVPIVRTDQGIAVEPRSDELARLLTGGA